MQPHDVLGVRRDASREELAAAYRRHALRHHPDRGGDRATFEAGAAAYRRLATRPASPPVRPGPRPRADVVFHRRRSLIASLGGLVRRRRTAPRPRP